jgi:hypothetical protein
MLPDADDAGRDHMVRFAGFCADVGLKVKVVQIPNLPLKGDVVDFFKDGRTKEELFELVKAARLYEPGPVPAPPGVAPSADETSSHDDAWPVPLSEVAYHGLFGNIVRAVEPHTESSPAALLLQLLTMFGNPNSCLSSGGWRRCVAWRSPPRERSRMLASRLEVGRDSVSLVATLSSTRTPSAGACRAMWPPRRSIAASADEADRFVVVA